MQIQYAIVKLDNKQTPQFGIFAVKPHMVESNQLIRSALAEFANWFGEMPALLAYNDTEGKLRYVGARQDLLSYIAQFQPEEIPWKTREV